MKKSLPEFSINGEHIRILSCPNCVADTDLNIHTSGEDYLLKCEECDCLIPICDVVYFTESCNPGKCDLECSKACTEDAIYFKRVLPGVKSKRIHINESCNHCGKCADACPLKGLVKIKTPVLNSQVKPNEKTLKYLGPVNYRKTRLRPLDVKKTVPSTKLTFDYLASKIGENGFLVDDGCGSQNFKAYLKEDVFGVDVRVDHWAYHPINILAEGENLPIKSESVDSLTSNFVLEHASNPKKYLSEVSRVLKPGSKAFISVPTPAYHLAYMLCVEGWLKYILHVANNPLGFLRNPAKDFLVERAHEKDWSVDDRASVTIFDEVKKWGERGWEERILEAGFNIIEKKKTGNILSLNRRVGGLLGNSKTFGVHITFTVRK